MSTSHSGPVASTYFGPVANLLWSLSHYLFWSRGHYLLWTNGSSVLHESGQNSVGGLGLHSSKHFYICKIPGEKSRMQICIRIWQNNTDPNAPRSGSTTLRQYFCIGSHGAKETSCRHSCRGVNLCKFTQIFECRKKIKIVLSLKIGS